jgi:hypothetical protein
VANVQPSIHLTEFLPNCVIGKIMQTKNVLGETTPEKPYFAVRWIDLGVSQFLPPSFRA